MGSDFAVCDAEAGGQKRRQEERRSRNSDRDTKNASKNLLKLFVLHQIGKSNSIKNVGQYAKQKACGGNLRPCFCILYFLFGLHQHTDILLLLLLSVDAEEVCQFFA
jgi:hypothetical protein